MLIDWEAMLPAVAPAAKPQIPAPERPLPAPVLAAEVMTRLGDDRHYCTECVNLSRTDGRCLAAAQLGFPVARDYCPVRDILCRCRCFRPRNAGQIDRVQSCRN